MSRPCCQRHVAHAPAAVYFKPAGVPACTLEQVTLTFDEVEALRLADLLGQYQQPAAKQMKISRPTFARIVEAARRKVAEALIHGKALRIEGGSVILKEDTGGMCARRRCCIRTPAGPAVEPPTADNQKGRKRK